MKKGLLAFAAAAILSTGSVLADTWGVIGGFNSWADDVEMTEISDGVFTVTMESIEGDFKFRANHDWNLNFGADYMEAAAIYGNASSIPMRRDGYNFSTVGVLSDVTFTIDVNNSTLQVSGLPSDMVVPEPPAKDPALYLIGDPAGQWAPDCGIEMSALGNGVYTWYGSITAPAWFGFTAELSDDWSVVNANRYGPAEVNQIVPVGSVVSMVYQKDASWEVEKSGLYEFIVDIKNLTFSASATYLGDSTWGMIGSFNGWAADEPLTRVDEGVYSIKVESLTAGEEFKFRANGDWSVDLGASDYYLIDGDGVYGMANDGRNFVVGKDLDNATLTINVVENTLTVSGLGSSGIDAISSDAAAPVFYNLQGIPVENPQNGVFIRIAGGKTSKVAL